MKKAFILLSLLVPLVAYAGWFEYEAGIGVSQSKDMGDGTWYQEGMPHKEVLTAPAYLGGLTGDIGEHLSWHADYVYFGQFGAGCVCVPDSAYNPATHTAANTSHVGAFMGFGHTQGIALTLGPHTDWHGFRFGIEGGPWIYRATWHDSLVDMSGAQYNLNHRTVTQFGWTAGARVERNGWGLSYRYYSASAKWNPQPGLVTGTHMFMITKRF
jgi:hypothetical protein